MNSKFLPLLGIAVCSICNLKAGHDFEPNRSYGHRPDVLIFEDAYQRGEAMGLQAGDVIVDFADLPRQFGDWNDTISSIRLSRGTTVILYEHAGFRGRQIRLTHSENNLAYLRNNGNWNDRVSSLRVLRPSRHERGDRHDNGGRDHERRDRDRYDDDPRKDRPGHPDRPTRSFRKEIAVLFEHANFHGDALHLFDGQSIPDLSSMPGGWNDSISSIRLKPGVVIELYEHAGYRGRMITISHSESNLARPSSRQRYDRESWNDRVSSIRVRQTI